MADKWKEDDLFVVGGEIEFLQIGQSGEIAGFDGPDRVLDQVEPLQVGQPVEGARLDSWQSVVIQYEDLQAAEPGETAGLDGVEKEA